MKNELLGIEERVEIAIQTGESHFREFKSALEGSGSRKKPRQVKDICQNIAKTLVSFANADGGELIVGIEDDSSVTGVPHKDDNLEMLLCSPNTHIHKKTPLSNCMRYKIEYEGKLLLYFQTPKSAETIHLTSDGLCLQRKDRETVPIPPHEIAFERKERASREYDRQFIERAVISDLDTNLIIKVANNISKGLSPEKCLQHLNLAEYTTYGLKIKRGALLLFAKEISKWHPRSQVRLIKVSGLEIKSGDEYNASEGGIVRGNIISLISETWEKLRPFLVQTKLSSGAIFETKIMYPELACKEAIVNAIAHRDYNAEGKGIEVWIFDDRLEIKSPGMLLSTISVDDIRNEKGVHESRNALIARVLREKGFMRELGEGMRRIYSLFRKKELAPPELVSENDHFIIKLHHKSVYTTEQKLWLEQFKDDDLSSNEKSVVLLGYDGNIFSAEDIWSAVGIVDTEDYRKLVHSLQTKGILAAKFGNTNEAKKIARKTKVPFRKFKRYYIIKPDMRGQARSEITKESYISEQEYEEERIYITNIPYAIKELDLYELFDKIGNVNDICIPVNFETGRPRGFAFVAFDNKKDAHKAIEMYNGTFLGQRKIAVSLAYKRDKSPIIEKTQKKSDK